MRADAPQVRLVLVGDGPDMPRLMQRCPDAVFSGLRRGEDLATHYASADVFLFPSITETFGNVVPEAMASGLTVVGYDYAAAGQLIRHGENGLLVYDISQPSNDIPLLGTLAPDDAAMGVAAAGRAGHYTWSTTAARLRRLYADLTSRSPVSCS